MTSYSRSRLTDDVLLRDLATHLSENRASTATLLADLGEVEERKLYVPAAYPSMHLYCVHELHMSEETAWKRLRAARAARQFPAIFPALADGRLHLTAVVLLAPHLTPGTADELLAAATHKSKSEIERLLAERFPKPDVPTSLRPIADSLRFSRIPIAVPQPQQLHGPVVVWDRARGIVVLTEDAIPGAIPGIRILATGENPHWETITPAADPASGSPSNLYSAEAAQDPASNDLYLVEYAFGLPDFTTEGQL